LQTKELHMVNNESNESGSTGSKVEGASTTSAVKAGWEALPTATKMILGGVFVIVGLSLLRFFLG
jgi:hypothetical protein